MKILLLGANSYVGARLYFELRLDFDVVGTFRREKICSAFIKLDITDKNAVLSLVKRLNPEVIIHAANDPGTRLFKEKPQAAVTINKESTNYVAEAAKSVKASLVYLSSFAARPDANGGLYGETKLASEKIIYESGVDYIILRPSLIIGCSPKLYSGEGIFHSIIRNLEQNVPAEYDNFKKYQPSYILHVSEVIASALRKGIKNTLIHVAVSETKTQFEIANSILSQFGIKVKAIDEHKEGKQCSDLTELENLNLPRYGYDHIIEKIVGEIKNKDKFVL